MRPLVRRPLSVLLAVATLAWAPADIDPRLMARLDPTIRDRVAAIIDSAARAGLDTEPLIDKALEAQVKIAARGRRGSPEAIVRLVGEYRNDMLRARAALGPQSTPQEVTAGANALRAGVPVRHLERLRDVKKGQRFAIALGSLTSLVIKHRDAADTAAAAIVNLVLASATDEQISALAADIEGDIQHGMPVGAAIMARADGLERVIAAQINAGGVPGAALPSARGTVRPADPAASGPVAGAPAGSRAPGSAGDGPRPPAPRGRDPKRP
jgi:hypothetical protein